MNKIFLPVSGFTLLVCLLFMQCRKNEDLTINEPYQPVYVSGGVYGSVVDELGNFVSNVKVSNGNNSVLTDQNGVFILQSQLLDKNGAQIKFEKAGYFTIYRSVLPIKDKMVYTKLKLIPKKLTQTFTASAEGVINVNGNAKLTIPKESVMDASGNAYSGNVQVYAYWLDPASELTIQEMPGNLSGRNKDGKEVVLQTLGMMAVELEDPAGNPLNIATGKYAELKLPIPSVLDAQAKSSIPMWYYNAAKGGWIEEGTANRQGNFYVGQVQHFSFWNCDYPFTPILLKGRVLDHLNRAIGNANIEVMDIATGRKGYGTTTSDGYFEGKIPASTSFNMLIGVRQCQTPFTMQFSASTSDVDLGDIKTTLNALRIFGKILDCSNVPVTNGYLQVWNQDSIFNSSFYTVNSLGEFDGNVLICSNSDIRYKAIDFNNLKQTDPAQFHYDNQSEVNLGNLKACETLKNVIIVNANGSKINYINAVAQTIGNGVSFFGEGPASDSSYVSFNVPAIKLNTVQNPDQFHVVGPLGSFYYSCGPCANMNVTLTNYGAIGTQITGTFTGKLKDWTTSLDVNIQGEFSVERKQ